MPAASRGGAGERDVRRRRRHLSTKHRVSGGHLVGEVVATAGLIALIFALARTERGASRRPAVGAYIGAAYWFTSSTSFANPAVTVGRMFSDTFAGIAPGSVPAFIGAQDHRRSSSVIGARPRSSIPRRRRARPTTSVAPARCTDAQTIAPTQGTSPMHLVAIGGSDAGISAALRARELDPTVDVTVVVADAYPNFSICGIPYYVSGEVTHWRNLAHRTHADLEATGMRLRLDTPPPRSTSPASALAVRDQHGGAAGSTTTSSIVGTGALPVRRPIAGLDRARPRRRRARAALDGRHLRPHAHPGTHPARRPRSSSAPDTSAWRWPKGSPSAASHVTQIEMLPEVLPTVDPELGALVHAELRRHGVEVHTGTTVTRITRTGRRRAGCTSTAPDPTASRSAGTSTSCSSSSASGRTPTCSTAPAPTPAPRGAVVVDEAMRTGLPHVWAAGDCVVTHHRLLGAHLPAARHYRAQAGPGRRRERRSAAAPAFAGSLGTQVVKVFDLVAARTGLRDHEATAAGYTPRPRRPPPTTTRPTTPARSRSPSASPATAGTGQLLGAQLVGARGTETAKRVDIYATALFHGMTVDALSDLDLSYTPPLGSPWDAVQMAAQAWVRRPRRAEVAQWRTRPRSYQLGSRCVHDDGDSDQAEQRSVTSQRSGRKPSGDHARK